MIYQVVIFKIGIFISAPFFTPYMLAQIKLNYWQYMTILVSSLIGRMLSMQFVHYHHQKFATAKSYYISMLGICFIPMCWSVSSNFYYLSIIEILSGITWGIFDIVFFLAIFNDVSEDEQTGMIVSFNFLNSIAICVGTVLGIFAFKLFNDKNIYFTIFILSSCIRFICFLIFYILSYPSFTMPKAKLFMRIIAVRPNRGAIVHPIVASIEKRDKYFTPTVISESYIPLCVKYLNVQSTYRINIQTAKVSIMASRLDQ